MTYASGERSRVRLYSTMSLFQSRLRSTMRAAKSPPTVTPARTRARRCAGAGAPRHAHRRQIEVTFAENTGPQPVRVEDKSKRGKEPRNPEGSEPDVSFAAAPAD